MEKYQTLRYEKADNGVLRIVLDRPELRNAQNTLLLRELDKAFTAAVLDAEIKVIVLAGVGPHFSSGHDLKESDAAPPSGDFSLIGTWGDFGQEGAQGRFAREQDIYLQATRRWRNLSKPTIAEVQGRCIAGGLMLAWACDLIVASDDALFCDPTVAMGACGVEWFVHPWELGPRKAKELLWTGDNWTAQEAHSLGMVNQVVPRAELTSRVMSLAAKIASKPAFAVRITKEAVNRTMDIMGQASSVDQAFGLHQLLHAHNLLVHGIPADPAGLPPAVAEGLRKTVWTGKKA